MTKYSPGFVGSQDNTKPNFIRPELLAHPQIPKPLHGVNPRTIMGDEWWDKKRKAAYKKNNYHCWACGVASKDAEYFQRLEAHEAYDIDFRKGRMKLKEVVALCHSCHNFIHSGRLLSLHVSGEDDPDKIYEILVRGFHLLAKANIAPYWATEMVFHQLGGKSLEEAYHMVMNKIPRTEATPVHWSDWRLVIGHEEYPPLYRNFVEWQKAHEK